MTDFPYTAYAFLVGVGDYPHPQLADLLVTIRDAQAIADVLRDPSRCGYLPRNVLTIIGEQSTAANIRKGLQTIANSADLNSTVVVYFSGHGGRVQHEGGTWETYLCSRDADPGDLANTALSGTEFSLLLAAIRAQKVLVILDACHAGGAAEFKAASDCTKWKSGLGEDYYELLSHGRGRVIVASSGEDQVSYVRNQGDLSLFTWHFRQALCGGAAIRQDGLIHVLDVFHFVNEAVRADKPSQVPVMKAENVDLNFAIALDNSGTRVRRSAAVDNIRAVRQHIIRNPVEGAEALSQLLITRREWVLRRNEVDLKRSELESIQHDLDLYGPNDSDKAARNRIVFFLLRACLEMEEVIGTAVD